MKHKRIGRHALMGLLMAASALLMTTCKMNVPTEEDMYTWIVTSNIDGSDLQYLYRANVPAYFVPDPNDPQGECILINGSTNIELMNLDGTDIRTIIDTVGSVYSFSRDRTRMLLNQNGEIYMANTDGSGLQNLTQTPPELWERYSTFSPDETKIVYAISSPYQQEAYLEVLDLNTGRKEVILHENPGRNDYYIWYTCPTYIDPNTIVYIRHYHNNDPADAWSIFSLHKLSLDTLDDQVLIDDNVFDFYYDPIFHRGLIESDDLFFVNTEDFSLLYTLYHYNISDYYHRLFPFSNSGLSCAIDCYIYNVETGNHYRVESYMNDFNSDETRIVGHARGHYNED